MEKCYYCNEPFEEISDNHCNTHGLSKNEYRVLHGTIEKNNIFYNKLKPGEIDNYCTEKRFKNMHDLKLKGRSLNKKVI